MLKNVKMVHTWKKEFNFHVIIQYKYELQKSM